LSRLGQALARLATDLDAAGARWALVGGFAVSLRARPRTTFDIDVAVGAEDDRQAESLVRHLIYLGYRQSELVLEQTATSRLATVRLLAREVEKGPPIPLDLLFASSGIEPEIVATAERLEVLPGLVAPVALLGHLLAQKILAGRDQDWVDARRLLENADATELRRARESLELITARGFARGKDLVAGLSELTG
jgi:hypothetical protein